MDDPFERQPWFWPLMTQPEQRMWYDPARPLVYRGTMERRMNKLHKFVPPMTLVAVEQNIFGEHRPAPSIADPKYGAFMGPEGFAFPNRPVRPVEMAVFDDSQLVYVRRDPPWRGAAVAITIGLAFMAYALWELAK